MRPLAFFCVTLLVATVLAGCISEPQPDPSEPVRDAFDASVSVVDWETDQPIPYAFLTFLANDTPVLATTTAMDGTRNVTIPAGVTGLWAAADGYLPQRVDGAGLSSTIRVALDRGTAERLDATGPVLSFRDPVDLGTFSYPVAVGTSCQDLQEDRDGDCGLGEPSVEVDALGQIYVSGVCCIGAAPPVYVSRDDGETFQPLETPLGVREAFGIEGDFAIDDNGVVYFADIELAATFQVTAWDKDGAYIRHAKWPAPPLVDRDWIRAEGDGHLYYVYNTGTSTLVYTSTDGGMTWSPAPVFDSGYGLGTTVKGLDPGELWVVGGNADGYRLADVTRDGGATWQRETTALPAGGMDPGHFDAAGNLYLASGRSDAIHVAKRSADGTWNDAWTVSPEGHHRMPWIAAGDEGKVAVAWYGTLDEQIGESTEWHLYVAVSLDADSDTPHWQVAVADPEPVLVGNLQRQLLDFFQVVIGPDDAIHIAYSKLRPDGGTEERLQYIRSERALPLSPETYFWGPK